MDFNPKILLMLLAAISLFVYGVGRMIFSPMMGVVETTDIDTFGDIPTRASGGAVAVGVPPLGEGEVIEPINGLRRIDDADQLANHFDTFTDSDLPDNYKCEMSSTDEPIKKRELIVVDDETFVMYATGHKFDCNYW